MNIDRLRLTAKHILQQLNLFCKTRVGVILVAIYICGAAFSVINTTSAVVTIVEDGKTSSLFTFNKNADDILAQAGVSVSEIDNVSFDGIAGSRGTITINRRKNVFIETNGSCTSYTVDRNSTVADVLSAANVCADKEDGLNYELDVNVPANTVIQFEDVSYYTDKKEETVTAAQYRKIASMDDSLDVFMLADGQKGILTTTYKYRLVNGQIESAQVVGRSCEPVETPAITNLSATTQKVTVPTIGKGKKNQNTTKATKKKTKKTKKSKKSKKAVKTSSTVPSISAIKPTKAIELDKKGRPVNYKKKISGNASAYTAYKGARTSTGKIAQTGYVAVNPKQIPYGTKLYIVSKDGKYTYGYAIAADTGGFTKWGTRVVDLYFDSYNECIQFGVRGVDIYVLD